jgi:hypothetical protein
MLQGTICLNQSQRTWGKKEPHFGVQSTIASLYHPGLAVSMVAFVVLCRLWADQAAAAGEAAAGAAGAAWQPMRACFLMSNASNLTVGC